MEAKFVETVTQHLKTLVLPKNMGRWFSNLAKDARGLVKHDPKTISVKKK